MGQVTSPQSPGFVGRIPSRAPAASGIALAVALAAALFAGCSSDKNPVAPVPSPSSGAVVRGVVADTAGLAIPNATVSLLPAAGPTPLRALRLAADPAARARLLAARSSGPVAGASAEAGDDGQVMLTDAFGKFSFREVASGDYLLEATAAHHLVESRSLTVPVAEAGTADTIVVVLQLRPTGSFVGRILLEGAADHSGSVVYLEGTSIVGLTGATGAFRLDDVPLGIWTITALHAGYLSRSVAGVLASAGEVVTLADLTLSRDLNLAPLATVNVTGTCSALQTTLRGIATDADGSVVHYEWDFEDDGSVDTSGAALAEVLHRYPGGSHRAKLIVTDDRGARGVGAANFTVVDPETLYVSSSTGTPGAAGTRAQPLSSITEALSLPAAPCPRVVRVAVGFYSEALELRSNVVVRGGFDPATWLPASGTNTLVWVGSQRAIGTGVSDAEYSDLEFRAANETNPSTSSVAMVLSGCAATLKFERCRFVAGTGQGGIPGIVGTSGRSGFAGYAASGSTGGQFPFNWPISLPRGVSGADGPAPYAPAESGRAGVAGCDPGGRAGTAGVTACPGTPQPGGNGADGQDGADGTPGGGTVSGARLLAADDWTGADGLPGGNGCVGSGGGSGGAGGSNCTDAGGGGGSGSVGGGGGTRGFGGRGGGSSIAVVVSSSSSVFVDCTFVAAAGGAGGDGGAGGAGGAGAAGGLGGTTAASRGGDGGTSGRGGHGGGGQGGSGGSSWCVYRMVGSSPTLVGSTYVTGIGGPGGLGGKLGGTGLRASSGLAGSSGTVGP